MSSWALAAHTLNNAQSNMGAAIAAIFPPRPVSGGFVDGTIIVITARLYTVGGTGDGGDVERLASPSGEWGAAAPLLTPRFGHAVSVGADHRIYAIGGRGSSSGTLLSGIEAYSPFFLGAKPFPGSWTAEAPAPIARERAAAATGLDGLIYVAGGSNGASFDSSSPLATLEAYDALTNTWRKPKTLMPMNFARDRAAAVTGTDGRIYVMGGFGSDHPPGNEILSSVEAYDPTTNTWEEMTPMTTPRYGLAAVLGPDKQIYAIGGRTAGGVLATTEVYNFETLSWTAGPAMITPRTDLSAAIGTDGRIYAIGGITGAMTETGTVSSVETLTV